MAIHVTLYHKTRYTYDHPVGHGPHIVRLRPAPHCRTKILSYSQRIGGGEHFINWQQDPFSNWNARLVFAERMKELLVEVELVAEMAVYNPFDFFLEDSATYFPFAYEETLRKDVAPFMEKSRLTPKFEAYLAVASREILGHPELLAHAPRFDSLHLTDVHHEGGQIPAFGSSPQNAAEDSASQTLLTAVAGKAGPIRTIDFLVALNQRIQRDIKYLIRLEADVQPPEETLTKLSGSCRDSGWL